MRFLPVFLDLAQGAVGERLVWIARDAEIGDRVAVRVVKPLRKPDRVKTVTG
jgi:hypothetical protein